MDKLVTKLVMLLMFLMYFQYGMDSSTVPCVLGVVQFINCSNAWSMWISTGIAVKVNPYGQWENKAVCTACSTACSTACKVTTYNYMLNGRIMELNKSLKFKLMMLNVSIKFP